MYQNSYGDLVDRGIIDIISARAKRFRIKQHDLDDLQQEIVLNLLAFRFDPERSSATYETAVTAIIDNSILEFCRKNQRYRKHVEKFQAENNEPIGEVDWLAVDVRNAIASLPRREQRICVALAHGVCLRQVAADLQMGWPRLKRSLVKIRRHFRELGLDPEVPSR